jgi:Cu/Ag efflux pump CusA
MEKTSRLLPRNGWGVPQDIEDRHYPLTTSLLGIPGVQSIRSTSMFACLLYMFSKDNIEFTGAVPEF